MKNIIGLIIALLTTSLVFAQDKSTTITGKVISFEESLALEGVSITVKNTNKNSGTQADGTFSINVGKDDKVLVFSLAEYQTQEIKLTGESDYNIVLRRNETSAKINNEFKEIILTAK